VSEAELLDILTQVVFAVTPLDKVGIVEIRDLPETVRTVVAERDRLRATIEEQDYALSLAVRRDAERDRLRAVVDIVRDVFVRRTDDEWKVDTGALVVLADALDALDVSPAMGDES
jgi:hypothetical protein